MLDQEILDGFKQESYQILGELTQIIEQLEEKQETFPSQLLSDFSQRIDRIMGAAKTILQFDSEHLGLKRIGQIAELCKSLGYKASDLNINGMVPVFASFWADTVEVINDLLSVLEDPEETKQIAEDFSVVLQGRLEWLAKKIGQFTNASGGAPGAAKPAAAGASAFDVEDLLKGFGF